MQFRTIDLFAGIGGVRIGFENAGFTTVYANDFDIPCKTTYDLNFESVKLDNKDINDIDIESLPEFDFLLGGFPCQPFSVAGYRKGFGDDRGRGNLFFKVAEIIEKRKPLGVFLENVKNLEGHDKGRTFKVIKDTLENLGYFVKHKVLNSAIHGGIPQNRERIFIVGFKKKKYYDKFEFPSEIPLDTSVSDCLMKNVDDKYYYNGKPLFEKLKDEVVNENVVYQWRRIYVRENKSGVCPTLTANMGMGGHNVPIIKGRFGIRKITPKECFNLQGYPEWYKLPHISDSQLYKQAGNSVSVPLIQRLAINIYNSVS